MQGWNVFRWLREGVKVHREYGFCWQRASGIDGRVVGVGRRVALVGGQAAGYWGGL